MDLKRFNRVIRTQWWVLLLVALVSIWIAGYLTGLRNERLPDREAIASISFFPALEDITGEGVEDRLQEAADVAIDANAELLQTGLDPLAPWPRAEIAVDAAVNRLLFIGRGDSDTEATALATEMRTNLIEAGGLERPEDIAQQLNVIGSRMAELNGLIEQLGQPPAPNPELDTTLELLGAELENLRSSYASLAVMRIAPPPERSLSGIEAQMEQTLARMLEVRTEIAAIEPPPPPEESLELLVYRLQYEELQTIYQDLFIRQLEIDSLNRIDEVETFESTLTPVPVVANQALGLLAGLLLGVVGLVAADRVRNPVWSSAELEGLTTLPELPPRGYKVPDDRPWYLATGGGERKAGIQMLRATTEGLWAGGATLGIAGVGTQPEDIAELAADLAASIGVSGKSVLLIDANFDHDNRLMEFQESGISLSHLLRMPIKDNDSAKSTIRGLLADVPRVGPGLHSLTAGSGAADPADIMSGRTLALILEAASELFDAVIVSGAETDHPITHVLSQRLDAILLLGAAGKTNVATLETEIRELSTRRARIIGLVLLTTTRSRLSRAIGKALFNKRVDDSGEDAGPPSSESRPEPSEAKVRQLSGRGGASGNRGGERPLESLEYCAAVDCLTASFC